MKARRKRSNLTLSTHNRKKKRDKPYATAWPSSTKEVLGLLETYHIPKSPSCTIIVKTTSSKKRNGSMSPYIHSSPYKHTPSKATSAKKMRKCLFVNKATNHLIPSPAGHSRTIGKTLPDEVNELIPEAIQVLQNEGLDTTFIDFFRLIRQGNFPVDNIALGLFADVVRWYKCRSSTEMRYSRQSKLFWKLGYRLFGGRFINYMGGAKNEGQVVLNQSTKGQYSPLSSKINFAVPSLGQLTQFDPYDLQSSIKINCSRPFAPGLLEDMISTLGGKVKDISCCLTFDGKKIKQGLTPDCGDVDLFGFENKDSLYEKREKLTRLIGPFRNLQDTTCDTIGSDEISVLSIDEQEDLKKNLKSALRTLSEDILEIQEVRKKKDYAKQKLIERCGDENWKNSKFAMAISSMIAFIHDIDNYLETVRGVVNEILSCMASVNGTEPDFTEGDRTNINECKNYHSLPGSEQSEECHSREVKQRTDKWHEKRKLAKVTGSTFYAAIGLDGLKKQQSHFDVVVCGNSKEPISERVSEFMQYGTENEVNAVATLVGKVIPAFFPGKMCCEEGFIEIDPDDDGVPFMIVSPDGSIRTNTDMTTTEIALEFKRPVMGIHKALPARYVLQCQAEIDALGVDSLVYLCWRPDYSSVFLVKKTPDLYTQAYQTAKSLYKKSAKRVKKLTPEMKELKELVQKSSQEQDTVEFLGLFPSVKHDSSVPNTCQSSGFRMNRLQLLLSDIVKAMEDKYELIREKATEAVVFICSTLDRHLSSRAVTAPVCWFTKGYSLDAATTRNILEHVLNACFKEGIHIPAISFDGQWHTIAVRDAVNKPLTKLQLQKDVWRETENMKKQSILNELKNLNKDPKCDKNNGVYVAYSSQKNLPTLSKRVVDQRRKEAKKQQKIRGVSAQENRMAENSTEIETNADVPEENVPSTSEASKTFALDASMASVVLTMLQTDTYCNKKQIWNSKTPEDILVCLQTPDRISKLRDVDLKVVVRYLKKNGQTHMKESDSKAKKVEHILNLFGLSDNQGKAKVVATMKKKRRLETPRSLKNLAYTQVSKLRKMDLNIIFAEYVWPSRLLEWQTNAFMSRTGLYQDETSVEAEESLCGFGTEDAEGNESSRNQDTESDYQCDPNDIHSADKDEQTDESATFTHAFESTASCADCAARKDDTFTEFFYIPAYSTERGQFEVSCVDSSHLLTRTRRKCCKGGLDGCPNVAWKKVARSGKTNLSTAMVECVLDQMSVSTALSHFSESVEEEMRLTGDTREADLCRDIRKWWKAEDDPGISASERVNMRLAIRTRLMGYVNFGHFPPPGMFVRGWPVQLWEALLASVDAKTLLYSLSKQNTYNTRAFSSLVGETFFSEVTLYDRRGQGTISSAEFEQFMGTAVEKLHMRLDDNRNFVYRTSHRTVYNLVGDDDLFNEQDIDFDDDILVLDHAFDKSERARVKGKKKEETVDTSRNALQRGSLGVRWEKGRRNESKLLPTTRMGIDDDY